MRHFLCSIFASCLMLPALASEDHAAALKTLRVLVPDADIQGVRAVPGSELLEVVVDNAVVYVSSNGRYVINGAVHDAHTGVELAELRRAELRQDLLAQAPRDARMLYAPAEITHRVIVFTDIDCGYCRRLHQQIPEYNALGIAIDYRFLPRAGIGSHSHRKAAFAWCADDPRATLDAAMAGQEPQGATCDDPIAEDFELARKLRLNGTPMLITEAGELIPTYLPPEQLAARLSSGR
ncbi:MAG TPA: DsbC family protein [Xanthomonadaceae bacterium]|nr:DsbC family protein [Xanthomonadaceae bacterium]